MTAYVLTAAGERWQLPPAVEWELEYTAGVPCDSFFYRCPSRGCGGADPALWHRFEGYEGEQLVFRGVVDECVRTISSAGERLELSGRGLAALLLDNEALPRDYGTATAEDILDGHVRPYGISVAPGYALPAVNRFSVAAGSSEWSVVYDFARYHGGVLPRFDREGRLVLSPWSGGAPHVLGDSTPVTELTVTDKRYGALSAVWVRDRYRDHVEKVTDPDFLAQGGSARRVITVPGRGDWQAMRYTGRYQLERAGRERLRIRAEIPELFWVWPGEMVQVARTGFDRSGLYRAAKVTVGADKNGGHSRIELALPDMV